MVPAVSHRRERWAGAGGSRASPRFFMLSKEGWGDEARCIQGRGFYPPLINISHAGRQSGIAANGLQTSPCRACEPAAFRGPADNLTRNRQSLGSILTGGGERKMEISVKASLSKTRNMDYEVRGKAVDSSTGRVSPECKSTLGTRICSSTAGPDKVQVWPLSYRPAVSPGRRSGGSIETWKENKHGSDQPTDG